MTEESRNPRRPARAADPWREAYRAGLPPGDAGCPTDEELASLVAGELSPMPPERRRELADHVVACARCAATYRTLAELDAEARRREGSIGGAPSRRRFVGWAAAATLVLGVGLALFVARRDGADGLRGGTDAASAVEPLHGARLAAPPVRLAWSTGEERGATARATLYDAEAMPLWESAPTTGSEAEIPPEIRSRLAAGGTFYWRVRFDGESGPRAGPLHRFEIAP